MTNTKLAGKPSQSKRSPEARGVFFACLSGILYGCLAYFGFALVNHSFSLSDMLFWRFLLATLVIIPFVWKRELWTRASFSKIVWLFLLGLFIYSVGAHFYFQAAQLIGSGLAMVVFFIFPLFVILLSWFIDRHKIGTATFISMTVILIGLSLLGDYDQANMDFYGLGLALLSGVSYAIYVYVSKKIEIPAVQSTFILCLGSAVLFFLLSLYQSGGEMLPLPHHWGYAFILALVCTLLPMLFLLKAMETITASKASILGVLEPVATLLVGILLLEEMITFRQWVGAFIVLIGALLVQSEPYIRNCFRSNKC